MDAPEQSLLRRRKKPYILGLLAMLGTLAMVYTYHNYQSTAGTLIKTRLSEYGLVIESLQVSHITASNVVLENIAIGKNSALKAKRVEARFNIRDVTNGKLQGLVLEGLHAEIESGPGGTIIRGLESLTTNQEKEKNAKDLPPVLFDSAALAALLPKRTEVKNARFTLSGNGYTASFSLDAGIQAGDDAVKIDATIADMLVSAALVNVELPAATITAALPQSERLWQGGLQANTISLTGLPTQQPALDANGTFALTADKASFALRIQDNTKQIAASITANIPASAPSTGILKVNNLRYPLAGGSVSASGFTLPLNGQGNITVPLQLEKVDLGELAEKAAEGKVKAEGQVSGLVPLTYRFSSGDISLGTGVLETTGSGTIAVSPEAIPGGSGKEMEIVRTALQNFHYTRLKIDLSSNREGKPVIALRAEGSNPDAFSGRRINLNLNLSGDALPLLQQSIMPVREPEKLIKKWGTEK